ncbi:hypothetical protein FOA32_001311 [Streptococcus sinensis]|nr:hypothetical protein [Streptococcus sinensis]
MKFFCHILSIIPHSDPKNHKKRIEHDKGMKKSATLKREKLTVVSVSFTKNERMAVTNY